MRCFCVIVLLALAAACGPKGRSEMSEEDGRLTNRLGDQNSPYLLQHAENPVHWQPWDSLAFREARRLQRPVFLSIGYSTCHWCHVMEEESFMDTEVAALMNETFVCVKVDREERPDIDNVYMRYAVAMTGSGGWPLTIIMTPEGEPFFAATYIPRESSFGRRGMLELIPLVSDAWSNRREEVYASAGRVSSALFGRDPEFEGPVSGEDPARLCFRQLEDSFDRRWGGFGAAPKFPSPHNVLFLLRYFRITGDSAALDMAERTLGAIRYGGIWDQLGGGIHRYSTDGQWHVPHFEKMLYDQALMALASLEAFQATGKDLYRRMAGELLDFVMREMAAPSGSFYSALDADSPGGEGAYYTWAPGEMESLLAPGTAASLEALWGIDDEGDLAGLPHGGPGMNVLRLELPPPGVPLPDTLPGPGEETLEALLDHRELRPAPLMDRKVLADWNGMTAAAMARGGIVLGRPDLLGAAGRCIDFVTDSMTSDEGRLFHSWKSGEPGARGFLDDYAWMIFACMELHTATLDTGYLETALRFQEMQDDLFLDSSSGVYTFSCGGDGALDIPRTVETHDGAVPSGNSITLLNLYRLWGLTGDTSLKNRADSLTAALSGRAAASPAGHSMLISAMLNGPRHARVTISGSREDPALRELHLAALRVYSPDITVIAEEREGAASAVACVQGACRPPVVSPAGLEEILGSFP